MLRRNKINEKKYLTGFMLRILLFHYFCGQFWSVNPQKLYTISLQFPALINLQIFKNLRKKYDIRFSSMNAIMGPRVLVLVFRVEWDAPDQGIVGVTQLSYPQAKRPRVQAVLPYHTLRPSHQPTYLRNRLCQRLSLFSGNS